MHVDHIKRIRHLTQCCEKLPLKRVFPTDLSPDKVIPDLNRVFFLTTEKVCTMQYQNISKS